MVRLLKRRTQLRMTDRNLILNPKALVRSLNLISSHIAKGRVEFQIFPTDQKYSILYLQRSPT